MEDELHRLSSKLIKLAHNQENSTITGMASASIGVKLPKISVPTFIGDIMDWRNFWEEFRVSIPKKEHFSEGEKLVDLKDALKDGPAWNVIQGLSKADSVISSLDEHNYCQVMVSL